MQIGDLVRYIGREYVVVNISWENGALMLQIGLKFGPQKQAQWVGADDVEAVR